jgi:chromosome segregation ATPase
VSVASRRNGGGTRGPRDLTIEILKQIRDEARRTNERLDQTNERLDNLSSEVRQLRADTSAGLARHEQILMRHEAAIGRLVVEVTGLNERFDNFLKGAHHEEHEALRLRIERLEERIGPR